MTPSRQNAAHKRTVSFYDSIDGHGKLHLKLRHDNNIVLEMDRAGFSQPASGNEIEQVSEN